MSGTTRGERASRKAAATTHTRRRRALVIAGVVALVVAGGIGFAWWRLEGNISRVDLSDDLGDRPKVADGPLNVLLIGSDNREGEGVPGASLTSGARSDTTLQLAWVIGGFIGIAMPLMPRLGLGIAGAVLALWAAFVLLSRPRKIGSSPGGA